MNPEFRITSVIPYRHPALLVDRVGEVEPGRRLVAYKAVSIAEPAYRGLAQGAAQEYAYPIGMMLESWAQAALLLACWERPNPDVRTGQVTLGAGVRDARVLGPVYPGSVLVHEVTVIRDLGDTVITAGCSAVDGRPVLEVGQLTFALRPAAALARADATVVLATP
ncbi:MULTISPECIES: 3-hydroxyacyl-ACP dehydratase FabZ family protein [unclassified Streptomyces]|uniref:3-hydroxyacyl-ACP dehydratase FabZ family protein n=1 Tax=unclassified Streptomyces TaxID=2593676 RepID=UPI00381A14AF